MMQILKTDGPRSGREVLSLFQILAAISLFIGALILFRQMYQVPYSFRFLLWNLFLAWLPLGFALLARAGHRRRGRLSPAVGLSACAWLLLFPNALYIVTDFVHLRGNWHAGLFWIDLVIIFLSAFTGLTLGFLSLYIMQSIVRRIRGAAPAWLFVLGALGLSGFGVYLGRFLGWNSWDLIGAPDMLLRDIFARIVNPWVYPETFKFTLLFACFYIGLYLLAYFVAASYSSWTKEIRQPS